jgi:aspartyl-tRNA(Asn)/glutamyl-tRNA(Gln) amidotransferase subunit A
MTRAARDAEQLGPLLVDGAVERLRHGEVGAVEVLAGCIERVKSFEGTVKAFITLTLDSAQAEAEAVDQALMKGEQPGLLQGLPVAVKDNIDVAGVRTTVGSRFFEHVAAKRDANVIRRLRGAGAVLVGKTALHEFVYGATGRNPHYGGTLNPWGLERITGGSSSGSGAALATEMCWGALGSDTGGSVRVPSALNGVTGLRPTIGRVSNRGTFPIVWTFDTVGPMARNVRDLAAILEVVAGYDEEDPRSIERPVESYIDELERGVEGLRIGLLGGFFRDGLDLNVQRGLTEAAEVFARLGADVHDLHLPGGEQATRAMTDMTRAEAYALHGDRLAERPELFGADILTRLAVGEQITGADYGNARLYEREWAREVDMAFIDHDVLVAPASGIPAPLATEMEEDPVPFGLQLMKFSLPWSLAGVPALAVPSGLTSDRLPVSMQLIAAPWREAVLIRAAGAFQAETNWHKQQPSLLQGS